MITAAFGFLSGLVGFLVGWIVASRSKTSREVLARRYVQVGQWVKT